MTSHNFVVFVGAFLPALVLIYGLCPQKHRGKIMLLAGYGLYFMIDGKLIVYAVLSTLSVYGISQAMAYVLWQRDTELMEAEGKAEKKAIRAKTKKKLRLIMAFAILLHIGLLFVLKYSAFFGENLNRLFRVTGVGVSLPVKYFALPLGISFYTLQAVAYLFDIQREKVKADRNIGRVALFLSFFGSFIEGPISRYEDTAEDLWAGHPLEFESLRRGGVRVLIGIVKRYVIANRFNMFISTVFTSYAAFDGVMIALAMLLFTIQLYMDFSGMMDVVIGAASIFGVKLKENFRQPFFSKSITEFWTRWHISLGAFFRDYVFYPLTMSKPLKNLTTKARRLLGSHYGPLMSATLALFVVWVLNGLWHGAGFQYLAFGMFHFVLITLGSLFAPLSRKAVDHLGIVREGRLYSVFCVVRTFFLVNIGELIFRAIGFRAALSMIKRMFTQFSTTRFADGTFTALGIDYYDLLLSAVVLFVFFIASVYKERGGDPIDWLMQRRTSVRFAAYYVLIILIVVFGAYGYGYVAVDPIYANF